MAVVIAGELQMDEALLLAGIGALGSWVVRLKDLILVLLLRVI
jgi:hypothetical protein